ncbi:4-hydroxythreonine-4-phosphate dehydrogenase PdxA [Gynuella sp.]|uniref:4-hydroxythreonine-4-phosphate dehydrogenase PdxA n=1 Tax=Gynuella sp. TaxID=2969146 RepID=UPI003D099549
MTKRILVTPGEPAGIGPDLCLSLAQHHFDSEIILVADPEMLKLRALLLGLDTVQLQVVDLNDTPQPHQPGTLKVLPVSCGANCEPGKLNPQNARYILKTLDTAIDACLNNQADAVTTGPVNKAVINDAGIPFTGHTEYFQQRCHTDRVVMMLATEELKVALATTHIPLRKVADAITPELLEEVMNVLMHSLQTDFGLEKPRLLVAGLNPHAGESGHLGSEDDEIIAPVIQQWRELGFPVTGPLPADTMYARHWLDQADATLAMYHDQGLPVLKHSGFGRALNITLGLPIIRTSVDHGTALDLAGTGHANNGSLLVAIHYAEKMAANRARHAN